MSRVVRVVGLPSGCRVYVCGLRWHHGRTGVCTVLVGLLARRRSWLLLGLLLCLHDRRDWPWPLLDP